MYHDEPVTRASTIRDIEILLHETSLDLHKASNIVDRALQKLAPDLWRMGFYKGYKVNPMI